MDRNSELDIIREELVHRGYLGNAAGEILSRLYYFRLVLVLGLRFGAAGGLGLALVAVVFTQLVPLDPDPDAIEALLLGLYSALFYFALFALVGILSGSLLVAIAMRFPERIDRLRGPADFIGGLASALVVFPLIWWVTVGWNPDGSSLTPSVLAPAAAAVVFAGLSAGFLVAGGIKTLLGRLVAAPVPARGRLREALVGIAVLLAFGLASGPFVVREMRASADDGPVAPLPVYSHGSRVFLLGLDGFTPELVEELTRNRVMVNLRRLMAESVIFRLETTGPVASPALWTSVATGFPARVHGVSAPVGLGVAGVGRWFNPPAPPDPRWFVPGAFSAVGLTEPVPPSSGDRRVKSLWDLAGDAGLTADVINWWATWPAEEVNGRVVSDRFYVLLEGMTGRETPVRDVYPRSLLEPLSAIYGSARGGVRGSGISGSESTANPSFRYAYDATGFHFRTAEYFLETAETDLTLLYIPGMDLIQRYYRRPESGLHDFRLGTMTNYMASVTDYASYLDRQLGTLLSRLDEECLTVVVFYPGWSDLTWREGSPVRGLCLVRGKGVSPKGSLFPRPPESVAACVLSLLGLPLAGDMGPEAAEFLFSEEHLRRFPLRYLNGYGPPQKAVAVPSASESDRRYGSRLESIGYLPKGE